MTPTEERKSGWSKASCLRVNKGCAAFSAASSGRGEPTVARRHLGRSQGQGDRSAADGINSIRLNEVAFRIKVAHAALATADPAVHELCTHLDVRRQHIVVALATRVVGRPSRQPPGRSRPPGRRPSDISGVPLSRLA
jgi:hypothetical protein